MKKYKTIAIIFFAIGLILSHIMCANVAFLYCNMLCGINHKGYSAPADIAFLLAIPYLLGIIVSLVVATVFWLKFKRTL